MGVQTGEPRSLPGTIRGAFADETMVEPVV